MKLHPIHLTDFYKVGHIQQYPAKTTKIYSNLTPRGGPYSGMDYTVVFGIQYFILEYLMKQFDEDFFSVNKAKVVSRYKRRLDNALGEDSVGVSHVAALWDLGYLPLLIKALPEGTRCDHRVPMLTITNTHADFSWLVNYLETLLSTSLWLPMTSASTADKYRQLLDKYAIQTTGTTDGVDFQAHDFSMRGLPGVEAASMSGAGHLLSFLGTDTIPAIDFLENYYGADSDSEIIGMSVPATEHSVMCLRGKDNEIETFRELIEDVYPKGIVSIVSDSWDYWKVITEFLPQLKDKILARDGKVVIRPDSGDPVKIICGDYESDDSAIAQGTIQCLWDTFGGTDNEQGYKVLNPHIGLIYGDSITYDRADEILSNLEAAGFASSNIVFGVGSFTYQMVTRDTHGFAVKATYGIVDGEHREIFKDPKTDNGLKRSAKGLLRVEHDGSIKDQCTSEEEQGGLLQTVFLDSEIKNITTLSEIRERLNGS